MKIFRTSPKTKILALAVMISVWLCSSVSFAQSMSFEEQVAELLQNHPRIKAANATVDSLADGLRVAQKAWYPGLAVTGSVAKEDRDNINPTDDTTLDSTELKLTLTQPVYDFGSKAAATTIARLQLDQAGKTLKLTKQSIILEIGAAQMGVAIAVEKLRYAKRSLSNLRKQTKLENIKVQSGAGVSTDVLQAKVQLAGAKARLLAAEGQLKTQENRYSAVFGAVSYTHLTLPTILRV